MGRPRSSHLTWLPEHCYVQRKRIVYIPPGGGQVRLCAVSEATRELVIQRLAEYLGQRVEEDKASLKWLCDQYNESPQFQELNERTRNAYKVHYRTITNFAGKGGRLMGSAAFAQITPGLLQKYLDRRAEQGAPVSGNREVKGYLSAVFSWGLARDYLPKGSVNPCLSVERNKEVKRKHYVEDWIMLYAIKRATPEYLPLVMWLCYLLGARITEVLLLQRGDLTPDGVRVRRLKGSKTNVIEWSPLLEDAVNRALGLPSRVGSIYLLHDDAGQPFKYSRVRNAWDDLMAKCIKDAEAEGIEGFVPFTRHDLKKKGTSDHKDGRVAGHKTESVRNDYRLLEDIVEPVR